MELSASGWFTGSPAPAGRPAATRSDSGLRPAAGSSWASAIPAVSPLAPRDVSPARRERRRCGGRRVPRAAVTAISAGGEAGPARVGVARSRLAGQASEAPALARAQPPRAPARAGDQVAQLVALALREVLPHAVAGVGVDVAADLVDERPLDRPAPEQGRERGHGRTPTTRGAAQPAVHGRRSSPRPAGGAVVI